MRHAGEPDTLPADGPNRSTRDQQSPPVTRSGRRAARSEVDAPAAPRDYRPADRYERYERQERQEKAPEPSRPALPSRRQVRRRPAEPPQFIAPPAIRPVAPVPGRPVAPVPC